MIIYVRAISSRAQLCSLSLVHTLDTKTRDRPNVLALCNAFLSLTLRLFNILAPNTHNFISQLSQLRRKFSETDTLNSWGTEQR